MNERFGKQLILSEESIIIYEQLHSRGCHCSDDDFGACFAEREREAKTTTATTIERERERREKSVVDDLDKWNGNDEPTEKATIPDRKQLDF